MPTVRPITPQTLFAQGQFEALLACGLLGRKPHPEGDDWAYVAAALALSGRVAESEALLRRLGAEMSAEARAFVWFHARPERLVPLRHVAPFYAWHAVARAHFARGSLLKAERAADRAQLRLDTVFAPDEARALNAELRVHLAGMRGDLARCEAAFASARRTAGLDLSLALYRARHGHGEQALSAAPAVEATRSLGPTASLCLERARLALLDGKWEVARRALSGAAAAVEQLSLPRYDRAFALRRCDFAIERGELADAVVQLRVIEAALDQHADAILAMEVFSRKIACLAALGRSAELADAARQFSTLRRRTGYVVPQHPIPRPGARAALNVRQLTFLAELQSEVFTDVHAYRQRFQVSEVTACRDLAAMVSAGVLKRFGKARATRYAQ